MSIIMRTVYPCANCGEEVSPAVRFCPSCGTEQPSLVEATVYNVLSRWPRGSESFHVKFGGDPILTAEDLAEAVATYCQGEAEYFMATYRSTDFDGAGKLCVRSWQPVVNGVVGEDQGQVIITLNPLE